MVGERGAQGCDAVRGDRAQEQTVGDGVRHSGDAPVGPFFGPREPVGEVGVLAAVRVAQEQFVGLCVLVDQREDVGGAGCGVGGRGAGGGGRAVRVGVLRRAARGPRGEQEVGGTAHDRVEKTVFGAEVVVNRPRGHMGGSGDSAQTRLPVAVAEELLPRGPQYALFGLRRHTWKGRPLS